ncbi:hypothetical protein D7006_24960 [Xanthobacter sp. YC-JY1]|nr:hypothetical protein D7006_24960 [Xanthobacter sp. YC-JY1]
MSGWASRRRSAAWRRSTPSRTIRPSPRPKTRTRCSRTRRRRQLPRRPRPGSNRPSRRPP